MMKLSKKALVTVGACGALALGVAAPAAAWAGGASATASTQRGGTQADNDGKRAERQQEFAESLAAELGVDQAKVSAALEKVQAKLHADRKAGGTDAKPDGADRTARLKERLAEAVKAGKLTQAEADAIVKAAEAGVLGGHGAKGNGTSSGRSGR